MIKSRSIKKLKLNRETIRTLTPAQLEGVAGGTSFEASIGIISAPVGIIKSLVRAE